MCYVRALFDSCIHSHMRHWYLSHINQSSILLLHLYLLVAFYFILFLPSLSSWFWEESFRRYYVFPNKETSENSLKYLTFCCMTFILAILFWIAFMFQLSEVINIVFGRPVLCYFLAIKTYSLLKSSCANISIKLWDKAMTEVLSWCSGPGEMCAGAIALRIAHYYGCA